MTQRPKRRFRDNKNLQDNKTQQERNRCFYGKEERTVKKMVSVIGALLALSLLTVPALADAIPPSPAEAAAENAGPVFALSVVIVAAVVLIRAVIRKMKK